MRGQRERAVLDVDVDRAGVDAGQIGVEHIVVVYPIQVHGHELRDTREVPTALDIRLRVSASTSVKGSKRSTAEHLPSFPVPVTSTGIRTTCAP